MPLISELGTNVKNTDNSDLVLCVEVFEKGAKSSNVKEYAELDLNTLPRRFTLHADAAARVTGCAFTLTCRCLMRAEGL